MNIFCNLGLHRYRTVRVIDCLMPFVNSYLEGSVCKSCGRMRPEELFEARITLGMMQRVNPEAKFIVYGPIIGDPP